jgi:hypothetical protein
LLFDRITKISLRKDFTLEQCKIVLEDVCKTEITVAHVENTLRFNEAYVQEYYDIWLQR